MVDDKTQNFPPPTITTNSENFPINTNKKSEDEEDVNESNESKETDKQNKTKKKSKIYPLDKLRERNIQVRE